MTVAKNRERGHDVEAVACERWPAERVGDDEGPAWYDVEFVEDVTPAGSALPIVECGAVGEVKSCFPDYHDRAGRWWLRKANHERLLAADGVYILAVVERETGRPLRLGLLDARTVDALIEAWWDAGRGGHGGVEYYRQIPWTRVFKGLDGPAEALDRRVVIEAEGSA